MLDSNPTRKIYKVVVVVALFGAVAFFSPDSFLGKVRTPFFQVTYVFSRFFQVSAEKTTGFFSVISSINDIKKNNEGLAEENSRLMVENTKLKKVEEENNYLRNQLGILPRKKFNLEAAQVIEKGTVGLNDWVIVDKGSDSGLQKGMAAIVSDGILVGKVAEVLDKTSKIVFITNVSSVVNSVTVETGAKGVVKGEYGLGIILDMILQTDSLKVGDSVVTSDIGEIPKDLLVGTIKEVRPSSDHLFQQAIISSPVDFSKVNFVFVIK